MFSIINLLQDQSKISRYISSTLLEQIETCLKAGEKTILYLNKRGAFSSLVCKDCQYLFQCENCDTSLKVHYSPNSLRCHLCQQEYKYPVACPECGGVELQSVGVGTQQIEQALRGYFSKQDINIYRFDSDTMKTIKAKSEAVHELEKADIIIGTKMISTGFDLEKVGCICVLLIEAELGYPSFDSTEKAYRNLRQIIGRGNRKSQKTEILLQTFIPQNELITNLTEKNYKEFLEGTLQERKEFGYPPFTQMLSIEYRHKDEQKSLDYIASLHEKLQGMNTDEKYILLCSTTCFKKNRSYHSRLILRGPDIRDFIKPYEKIFLSTSNLVLIFHS